MIKEADWSVGQILNTLENLGLTENTLVVFSSDNGPVLDDGYHDDAVIKVGSHDVNGVLRGGKYSLFDAGTRVPFFVSWPGTVEPGVSEALVCQVDLMASIADILGIQIPSGGEDSEILTDALLGKSETGRTELVMEAGGRIAVQKGDWYFIPPHKGPKVYGYVNIESGCDTVNQLYKKSEPGQEHNLAEEYPEIVKELEQYYHKKTGK